MIAGATRPEQVKANVAAGAWVPSDDERAALEKVLADPDGTVASVGDAARRDRSAWR